MSIFRTKRRTLLRWLVGLLALTGIALLSLPIWFPWVLKPALGRCGIRYDAYDRLGYSCFSLSHVKGQWPNLLLEADQVRCVLPTAWVWQRFKRGTNGPPTLAASGWRMLIERSELNTRGDRWNSALRALDKTVAVGAELQRGAPLIELTNGRIEGVAWSFGLPSIVWCKGHLSGEVQIESLPEVIRVAGVLDGRSSISITAALDAYNLGAQAKLQRGAASWKLDGKAVWLTNQFDFSAGFEDAGGWWPTEATLDAKRLQVPANLLRLPGYDDPTGSLALNLVSNQFLLQATATALPAHPAEIRTLPRVEAALRVQGNPNLATVEQLEIRTPWLQAELTNSFAVWKEGRWPQPEARFRAKLGLAELPQVPLKGAADGIISLGLADVREPTTRFEFSSTNFATGEVEANLVQLRGEFDWPVLALKNFDAKFEGGSTFSAAGTSDIAAREILAANWRFSGPLPAQRLGGLQCRTLDAYGRISGAFTNLLHSGEIAMMQVEVPTLKPFDARVRWQATNLDTVSADVELSASNSVLSIAGGWNLSSMVPVEISANLETFTFKRDGGSLYSLAQPVAVRFQNASVNRPEEAWRFTVDGLDWQGDGRRILLKGGVDWPSRGHAIAKANGLVLGEFSDLLPKAITSLSFASFDLESGWTNGPLESVLTFDAALAIPGGHPLGVKGALRSGDVLKLDQLTLMSEHAPGLIIDGTLPFRLTPGTTNDWLSPAEQGEISLRAALNPVEQLSLPLGGYGEAILVRPRLTIAAGGSIEAPSVSLEVAVPEAEWRTPGTNHTVRSSIQDFQLSAVAHASLIELNHLSARWEEQELQAGGQWPLPAGFWRKVVSGEVVPDWSPASAHLKIEDAQLAALAHHLPSVLAPEGNFSAYVALEPERRFAGTIWLTNAATRQIGSVPPLRNVNARVRFNEDRATLEDFRGNIGGQPVRATGQLQLDSGQLGDFQVSLSGSNVPLARSLEFLTRGDFDLKLNRYGGLPAELSGTVNLRDGLFVQSATALMATRPERPALRPPYFSITNEPFADWRLKVAVGGDRFLRIRSPVFNGVVSADVELGGTLREPLLTGDARVNSGRVVFPFGTLGVDQAHANLDGNDPRGPDLLINASGRTLGYDLRLEVSGPADGANVIFSSTPPLSSEQILLMLTAGELPNDEHVFSNETRAGRLATFLGRDILTRYSGSDTAGERFVINTGENLTAEGKATYSLEYRLTDRWSLIGEYDRFSALNAMVKWRILSR